MAQPQWRSSSQALHLEILLFSGLHFSIAKATKPAMASAMEAEMKALLMNAQLLAELRRALEEMGHPQPPTRIRIDNKSAHGVLTGIMKQKRTKSTDMNANWVKDRCEQGQFEIKWAPGKTNLADHPTKHHAGLHHRQVRPIQLFIEGKSPTTLQGCNRILDPASAEQSSGSPFLVRLKQMFARSSAI